MTDLDKRRKLQAAVRLLDSDNDGEVIASVHAIKRLLPEGKRVVDALALVDDPFRVIEPVTHWWTVAQTCFCQMDRLNPVERGFVVEMAHRNTPPTLKQQAWLRRIEANLQGRAA